MKIYFFLLLIVFVFSCQSQRATTNLIQNIEKTTVNNSAIKSQEKLNDVEEIISSTVVNCGNKDFNLAALYKNGKKSVVIEEGTATIKKINLPNQSFVNGFSLNWARETKKGFEISIEYGSRFYYEKNFIFICQQKDFYLSEIKIVTFDKQDLENSWKEYSTKTKPALTLEKFSIDDFIGND